LPASAAPAAGQQHQSWHQQAPARATSIDTTGDSLTLALPLPHPLLLHLLRFLSCLSLLLARSFPVWVCVFASVSGHWPVSVRACALLRRHCPSVICKLDLVMALLGSNVTAGEGNPADQLHPI